MDSELNPTAPTPESDTAAPGSFPLRNTKHEKFAVARAALFGLLEAAREAGYPDMTAGNAAKIDRMPSVRDRVKFLSGDTPKIVREVRAKVAKKLNLIRDASMADYIRMERDPAAVAAIEETIADPGKREQAIASLPVLPYLDLTRIAALAPDERREVLSAIKSVAYTDNGPKVELHSPLEAAAQLRALNGLDAAKRMELSGRDGGPIQTVDLSKATDEQLAALEAIFGPLALASGDAEVDPGGTREARA